MSEFTLRPVPAFDDNYIWAVDNGRSALLVDPGDAEPCIRFLEQNGLKLEHILVTHRHADHTGGIAELVRRYQPEVHGSPREHIPHLSHPVRDGDVLTLPELGLQFEVVEIPGHTLGHVAYYRAPWLFCGDTLFSCGCGRVFEGTPAMMHDSLSKLLQYPDDTQICCAHEYTLSNMSFALWVDPHNAELVRQQALASAKRQHGQPTLPARLGIEKAINPFLRCDAPAQQEFAARTLARPAVDATEVFATLRQAKNSF